MPNYFCETCRKLLARNEQRRNYENSTIQGPLVVTQINLPNQFPLAIGRALNQTRSRLMVRCVHCGSDAVEIPTKQDLVQQARLKEERQNQLLRRWLIVIVGVFVIVIVAVLVWGADQK